MLVAVGRKIAALLQAFGLSVGLCGLVNVLTTVGWVFIAQY